MTRPAGHQCAAVAAQSWEQVKTNAQSVARQLQVVPRSQVNRERLLPTARHSDLRERS